MTSLRINHTKFIVFWINQTVFQIALPVPFSSLKLSSLSGNGEQTKWGLCPFAVSLQPPTNRCIPGVPRSGLITGTRTVSLHQQAGSSRPTRGSQRAWATRRVPHTLGWDALAVCIERDQFLVQMELGLLSPQQGCRGSRC